MHNVSNYVSPKLAKFEHFYYQKNCSGIKFLLNWEHLPQFSGTPRMNELGPKTLIYSDMIYTEWVEKKKPLRGFNALSVEKIYQISYDFSC